MSYLYGGLFCKIKSRSCGEGFEDFYVVPGDGMSSGQGMMGGDGFDPVCGFVERIVESVASFVFFHAVYLERHCEQDIS